MRYRRQIVFFSHYIFSGKREKKTTLTQVFEACFEGPFGELQGMNLNSNRFYQSSLDPVVRKHSG